MVRHMAGLAKCLDEIGRRLAIILDDQDPHSGMVAQTQTDGRPDLEESDLPQASAEPAGGN